jgi:hypothetical protein
MWSCRKKEGMTETTVHGLLYSCRLPVDSEKTQRTAIMSKKHHGGPGKVPAGNQPKAGVPFTSEGDGGVPGGTAKDGEVSSQQEEDPKRRLGDFTGKGEHSIQEPDGKNGANH